MNSITTVADFSQDLYPGLRRKQRAYLECERQPSRAEAAALGPYPVTAETAATLAALQRHYVLPWQKLCERHLALWVRDDFIARGAREVPLFTPPHLQHKLKVFRRAGEARAFWSGKNYRHAL